MTVRVQYMDDTDESFDDVRFMTVYTQEKSEIILHRPTDRTEARRIPMDKIKCILIDERK